MKLLCTFVSSIRSFTHFERYSYIKMEIEEKREWVVPQIDTLDEKKTYGGETPFSSEEEFDSRS